VKTLFEAAVLVAIVIVLFLQTWRAAIIPIVAIPVSLIGTFFVMQAAGFSINNLTLFGMVLAIGIVVDDAIVVIENIERYLRQGLGPKEAAHRTMDEVGGALVAIALVLCAVFVPAAFITGLSGQFYRQFALTIAGATVISLIVSLTLSPAMCALLLKPHADHRRDRGWARPIHAFFRAFNIGFDVLGRGYGWLAGRVVRFAVLMLAGAWLCGQRWLARADPFGVYSMAVSRLSPFRRSATTVPRIPDTASPGLIQCAASAPSATTRCTVRSVRSRMPSVT